MGLKVNQSLVNDEIAKKLVETCPFKAISYVDNKLDINAGCKLCKMCVRNSNGVITFEEDVINTINKDEYKGICVYVDNDHGNIHPVTFELIGKAIELAKVINHEVYALLIGFNTENNAKQLLEYGVNKVFAYDDEKLKDFDIERYTNCFSDFINNNKPSSILVGATNIGRSLAPRVAARFHTGLTADCTKLEMKENTDLVQIRPAFGGNIMAQIVNTNRRPQFATVRYKVFNAPNKVTPIGEIINCEIKDEWLVSHIEVINIEEKPRELDISEADVIVAVGRGLKNKEDLAMINELAELLNGVVACSRPMVESGLLDSKHQIGLSGKTVKPKLIITLGISGAVQFTSGMKSSDCIVAINNDPNATIFDIANYGIVGDMYEIVPKLIQRIKETK